MAEVNLSHSQIFLFCLAAWLIGIALASFFSFNIFLVFCLILIGLLALIISWSRPSRRLAFFCWLFLFLGIFRLALSSPDFSDNSKIYHYLGETQKFSGTINNIDSRLSYQKLTIEADTLISGRAKGKISGQVLVNANLFPRFQLGDRVAVECLLSKPSKIQDFDYEKYLARYNIYALCRLAQVSKISSFFDDFKIGERILSQPLMTVKFFLFSFKSQLARALALSLPEPKASFFQGFILNERGNISQTWLDKFSLVGLTHVIAISGSHIVVIIAIISALLVYFGLARPRTFWLVVIIISAYTLMIGAPASAVRSVIMASALLYAQKIGRLANSANAVIFAAALMALVNPKIIIFDVGFQLSFLAVLGLIYLEPILRPKLSWLPNFLNLPELVSVSLAAQIATLPLIAFNFHRWSLLALLANLLVLPLVPLMMISGFVTAFSGALFLPLGRLFGLVSWFLGGYFLLVSDYLSRWPLAALALSANWSALWLLLYLPILFWCWPARRKIKIQPS